MFLKPSLCKILVLFVLFASMAVLPALAGKPEAERPARPVVGEIHAFQLQPDLGRAVAKNDRKVWTHRETFEGAAFVKPRFVDFNLRKGDVLIVRSASGRVVEELRGRGPKEVGSFWGLSAFGDVLSLELSFENDYLTPPFVIERVILGDPAMLESLTAEPEQALLPEAFAAKSVCSPLDNEDVFCYQGDAAKWSNVIGSVGVMTAGGNPAAGALWCSGANVSAQNYILTNYHCIANNAECGNSEFVFKYYRTGCGDGSPTTVDWAGFRCDEIVASSPFDNFCDPNLDHLDFSLNSVIGDPAPTYGFVQPDPTPLTSGEAIYIVQHPSGRPHEIAHGADANVVVDGSVLRYYDTLDTEGGSSGSPIFRESDDLLVGLHHCGGCTTPGVGNRGMLMSDIYPWISDFLCTETLAIGGADASGLSEQIGNGDAVIDPGETWSFIPAVRNRSCSIGAVNVQAQLQAAAGSVAITLLDTTSTFGDIPAGTNAPGTPVRFQVDGAIACSGEVRIDLVNITANTGGPFEDLVGYLTGEIGETPTVTVEFESFDGGLSLAWTVVDGGTGSGDAGTWTTDNPGNRVLLNPPFVIADSDSLGSGQQMDEQLITPVFDVTGFSAVTLQFDHNFRFFSGGGDEQGDVDVRSSATAGAWQTVASFNGASSTGIQTLDITAYAAADLQVRFHYHQVSYDWWWAIDDFYLLGLEPRTCNGLGPMFEDGFESGDLSAWSESAP